MELYEQAGFREVSFKSMQRGDALLMSIGKTAGLNHVAVYMGDQYVLHHMTGRLSSRDLLGDWLLKCTGKVLRHESR
jgi:cell wall-associated NlpC family hydrolase